jgi:hypothetical protein
MLLLWLELLLWLCGHMYWMLLRWLELAVLAVSSYVFGATTMDAAIGIGCAIRCILCYCYGWIYLLWMCDAMYSMLLLWLELSVLAVRFSYAFDAADGWSYQ